MRTGGTTISGNLYVLREQWFWAITLRALKGFESKPCAPDPQSESGFRIACLWLFTYLVNPSVYSFGFGQSSSECWATYFTIRQNWTRRINDVHYSISLCGSDLAHSLFYPTLSGEIHTILQLSPWLLVNAPNNNAWYLQCWWLMINFISMNLYFNSCRCKKITFFDHYIDIGCRLTA